MRKSILGRISLLCLFLGGVVVVLLFLPRKSSRHSAEKEGKLWFFKNGTVCPEKSSGTPALFPHQHSSDRITNQLMYIPEDYRGSYSPVKVILTYNGLDEWEQKSDSEAFIGCPVSRCSLTGDKTRSLDADAILYKDFFIHPRVPRPTKQIWILYFLESPYSTDDVTVPNFINWTATYRRDSDIVTPYEQWTYYDSQVKYKDQERNYAASKTKKVAWLVSNCQTPNERIEYAKELSKHIPVDIYGKCGVLSCDNCFELLDRDYKFYLAFENSNCRDYITEKLFVNALAHNVVPIVMGAHPEDYKRSAPEGSYIHVDNFGNPAELAVYLYTVDQNDDLYNSYFRWKGTGEFINTYFWCRLCAMLHAPITNQYYDNINRWWRGSGVCAYKSWNDSII